MGENIDFSSYAGRVVFPRNPHDLRSTTVCPACFTALTSTVCSACHLDLGHPAATELHTASLATAAELDKRLAIIGQIRYETVQAMAHNTVLPDTPEPHTAPPALPAAATIASSTPIDVAAPEVSTASLPSAATITAPARATAPPSPPVHTTTDANRPTAPARKHSSVQIILLIVGISLLSLAAIFFTVLAFVTFGDLVRTMIIGAITVGAVLAATLLRRRNLTAGAEGLAVFAVVLILGDASALYANNYFGLGRVDGSIYWGIVLLVLAMAFIFWNRMSALRAPSIVAFGIFAPGVGLIVDGLLRESEPGTRGFFVAATIALAGLIHRLILPRSTETPGARSNRGIERIISLSTTVIALFAGFIFALDVARTSDWSGTIATVALSIIAATQLWSVKSSFTRQLERVFGYIFSGMGAVFVAIAVGVASLRINNEVFSMLAPVIAAAVVTLTLEALALRSTGSWKRFSTVAAWVSASVLAIMLLLPVGTVVFANLTRLAFASTNAWMMGPTDVITIIIDTDGWAVLALAIVGVLATSFWTAAKTLHRRGPIAAWLAFAVLTAAVATSSIVWVTVAGWLALAVISITALTLPTLRGKIPVAYRAAVITTTVVTGVFGYTLSWASTSTWWIGSTVVIFALLASRILTKSPIVKASFLALAAVLALVASAAAAHHMTYGAYPPFMIDFLNGVRFISITSAVILVLSAVPLGRWTTRPDRRVMFWLGTAVSAVTSIMLAVDLGNLSSGQRYFLLLSEYGTSLAVALVVLIGLTIWVASRRTPSLHPERITASILTAPAAYFAVISLAKLLDVPDFAVTVAPIVSALIVAALTLAVTTLRPTTTLRWALDVGVVLVALPAVLGAAIINGEFSWFVLVIAAVAVLLLAIDNDGLFTSSSQRRHLGWASLALATAGLWWRLAGIHVTGLEAYVLPLSGALIVIAILMSWATVRKSETEPRTHSTAAPVVALGGLLVAVLPLAINASNGEQTRALIVGITSAILLLAGSFLVASPAALFRGGNDGATGLSAQRWWDSAALAGAIGVIVLMVGRAIYLPTTGVSRDAWIVGGFACVLAAAFGQAMSRKDGAQRMRSIGSQTLGVIAMAAVLFTEAPAFLDPVFGQLRALSIVMLFAAIHVFSLTMSRAPFTRLVGWIAISFAGIAAIIGSSVGAIESPEFSSVPIALALLAAGTHQLHSVPAARSWGWLAPGVLVLLVPSLMETFRDPAMWRIVGLGLVSIAVVIIGVVRKLQAPFVIGILVVLVHGIATFAPELRTAFSYVPWYLWLAVGGVLFTWIAIRFEQRKRDMKKVVMKFAELR